MPMYELNAGDETSDYPLVVDADMVLVELMSDLEPVQSGGEYDISWPG